MRTLVTSLCLAALTADEIHLADGRILDGEVLVRGPATAAIRVRAAGIRAEIQVPSADILRVVPGPTMAEQARRGIETRRGALLAAEEQQPQPVAAWWALAEAAKAADEPKVMRDIARLVIERDPDHAAARAALGHVRHEERWLSHEEAAVARGEVWFRGRWTVLAVRDAILAEEARVSAEARLARLRAARAAAAEYNTTYDPPVTQMYVGTTTVIPWAPAYYHPYPQPYPRPLGPCQPSGLTINASGNRPGFAWGLTIR